MSGKKSSGFTVIEVVLFLGITGLLATLIFVGTGNSINIQRYRDSVTSLKSILQQQYSEVTNVGNNHSATENACGGGGGVSRGQSDCVILGRYITNMDPNNIVVKTVVGTENSDVATDDKDSLHKYTATLSTILGTEQKYKLPWDTSMKRIGNPLVDKNFSLLIVRSPLTGSILTFIDDTAKNKPLLDLVDLPNSLTSPLKLCVNPNYLFSGKKMMIRVAANASSASGVEVLGDGASDNECT